MAASGLGYVVAELLSSDGATVFASDIASPGPAHLDGMEAVKLDVIRENDDPRIGALHEQLGEPTPVEGG